MFNGSYLDQLKNDISIIIDLVQKDKFLKPAQLLPKLAKTIKCRNMADCEEINILMD